MVDASGVQPKRQRQADLVLAGAARALLGDLLALLAPTAVGIRFALGRTARAWVGMIGVKN